MKGVVFVNFADFVEESWGLEFWDQVLSEVAPASEGVYTTVATYPDQELFDLIGYICKVKSISPEDAQTVFGRWLFKKLHSIAPPQSKHFTDPFAFLRGVQDVIHVEVKKLNQDAILPEFRFIEEDANSLTLEYISPRNLPYFCEGLILGLGDYMQQPLEVGHTPSLDDDASQWIMQVRKVER